MRTKAWVWGTHGIEFWQKGHGIFNVAFAVADEHKKKMAWYMWHQQIGAPSGNSPYFDQIKKDFDETVIYRGGIPEQRIRFGSLFPSPISIEIPVPFNALTGYVDPRMVPSTLSINKFSDVSYGCVLAVFTPKGQMSHFNIFLHYEAERHLGEFAGTGFKGTLQMLATEPFSQRALWNGPDPRILRVITTVW